MAAPKPSVLGELWAGHIYGTNTGKVFLEVTGSSDKLTGTLRLADDEFGLAVLEVAGSYEDGTLKLTGRATEAPEGVAFGEVSATAKLQQNGSLAGEWRSTAGTGGIFQLFPHQGAREAGAPTSGPEQLYTTTRDLGALRLYKSDLLSLIQFLERKFPSSKVVVSHIERGAELAQYADEFKGKLDSIDRLRWLKLNVQAADSPNAPRILTVDLGPSFNRVVTQGADESWVLGEAEALASFLKRREHRLSTAIGKHGLNVHLVIALGALIVLPELPLLERTGFATVVLLLLVMASSAQQNWIPNFVAHIHETTPSWISRIWPSALSWLISMTAGLAAAVAFRLLDSASR